MKHSKASFLLDAYEREEMPEPLRDALDRHTAGCATCRLQLEKTSRMKAFFAETPVAPAPQEFEEAVRSVRQSTLRAARQLRAEREASLLPSWLPRLGWAPLALPATVAALLVMVLVAREGQLTPQNPRGSAESSIAYMTSASTPQDFRLVREGPEVKIEWARNGHREHRVRKGDDPAGLKVASGQVVRAKVWTDGETRPAPGSVTYYLID